MKKVNLGCGSYPLEGYINVDNRETVKPDIFADVLKGLPFDSNSIDEVSCTEFLEHFAFKNVVTVVKEIHRILKPRGVFKFGLPDGIHCAMLLGEHYWQNGKRTDLEYLWNNVNGQKNLNKDYQVNQGEIDARLHRNLFNEQYLELLLASCGFKDIEFDLHMSAYEEWKEPYKLIGKAIKV